MALVLGLFASACGHARVVRRNQTGGVLALEGARNKATEDAHRIMSEHCRGPYTIVEEGEHVVGTDTAGGEETYVAEDGTVVTEGGSSTREATEWRISYVCGQSAPPPAGPANAPPPAEPAPPAGYEDSPPPAEPAPPAGYEN